MLGKLRDNKFDVEKILSLEIARVLGKREKMAKGYGEVTFDMGPATDMRIAENCAKSR